MYTVEWVDYWDVWDQFDGERGGYVVNNVNRYPWYAELTQEEFEALDDAGILRMLHNGRGYSLSREMTLDDISIEWTGEHTVEIEEEDDGYPLGRLEFVEVSA